MIWNLNNFLQEFEMQQRVSIIWEFCCDVCEILHSKHGDEEVANPVSIYVPVYILTDFFGENDCKSSLR
mgnify:CR=1 FL=1